jgi:signal transduction histidine kinase
MAYLIDFSKPEPFRRNKSMEYCRLHFYRDRAEPVAFLRKRIAVQHTPEGWVRVTAAIENGWLVISVEDSGPRVPDELKERIFEPFVSSRSEGSGLGLAVAREIVEAHGGTLRCVSGVKGAHFEIRLPHHEPLSSPRARIPSRATIKLNKEAPCFNFSRYPN